MPPGPRDLGVARYLGHVGRLRPDVTVVRRQSGRVVGACPIEVKYSADPNYLAQGFEEAHLYAREYEPWTTTSWPAAILVLPGDCQTPPQAEDRVVAVGWQNWVSQDVLRGLLA